MIAVNGKAKINPGIPQSISPPKRANIATRGLMLTLEPMTNGVIKLASINWTAAIHTTMANACEGLSVAKDSKMGKLAPIQIPMYGIKSNKPVVIPKKIG